MINNYMNKAPQEAGNSPLLELKVKSEEASVVKIKIDLSEILKTPTTVDFSKLSSVTDFNNATIIADNYEDMFTIIEVK